MRTPQDAVLWLTVSAVGMAVGRMKRHSPSMMWLPSVGASFLYRSDQPLSLIFTAILSQAIGTLSTIPDSQLKELDQRGEVTLLVYAASWYPRPFGFL